MSDDKLSLFHNHTSIKLEKNNKQQSKTKQNKTVPTLFMSCLKWSQHINHKIIQITEIEEKVVGQICNVWG